MRIGLLGSTGFVGKSIATTLAARGHELVSVETPRLIADAYSVHALRNAAHRHVDFVERSLAPLAAVDVLVNAAGHSDAQESDKALLFGANALLPATLAATLSRLDIPRFIHISSTSVYGTSPLDEQSRKLVPVTRYGWSKLAGEAAIRHTTPQGHTSIIYRPTSVHGLDRPLTRSLARFATSPLSSVAGDGTAPTPQILVANVAEAAAFLAETALAPADPVNHPYEGLTTASLLEGFGGTPRRIPYRVARNVIRALSTSSHLSAPIAANVRRLEMLWFGQAQSPTWLERNGYKPRAQWGTFFQRLREELR